MGLDDAIALVKAAGYRVSKPKESKPKTKNRVGPTIVCKFADGVVTRMSVFTTAEDLDWNRGIRLSQAAYQSRWRTQARRNNGSATISLIASVPPAIVAAHFEQDGRILARREFNKGEP